MIIEADTIQGGKLFQDAQTVYLGHSQTKLVV